MIPRPKRLPRLWCAMQGLLPWEAGVPGPRRGATGLRSEILPASDPAPVQGRAGAAPATGGGIIAVKVEPAQWYGQ
ncbi:MAG: hypothetical protein JNL92_21350 [Opitutaceae bacterium]|nr:hypothetical protein [Opitutaceae bacterium]